MNDNSKLYDTDDMSEIFLKCYLTSEEVNVLAKRCKFTPDDLVSGVKGMEIYKRFAEIGDNVGLVPCDKQVFNMHLNQAIDDKKLEDYEPEDIQTLFEYVFDKDVSKVSYMKEHAPNFIIRRRALKIVTNKKDDTVAIQDELSKLADTIQDAKISAVAKVLDPGAVMVKATRAAGSGILFNIPLIDSKVGGLGKGECALILGHSGSGKTAIASFLTRQMGLQGKNVLYISAEEPAENIVHRIYAQAFNIDYSAMHRGEAEMEKQEAWGQMTDEERAKISRIRVVDVRDLTPISPKGLIKVIEQQAAAGFIADAVVVDQLDYTRPDKAMPKGTAKWQEYETTAFELDTTLSQHKIQGIHEFALVVIHQATGEMLWSYDYDKIAGCKGIVRPFDLAMGVGREDKEATHINLFSLKVRHASNFSLPMRADFSHMTFTADSGYKNKAEREKEARKSLRAQKAADAKASKNEMVENTTD